MKSLVYLFLFSTATNTPVAYLSQRIITPVKKLEVNRSYFLTQKKLPYSTRSIHPNKMNEQAAILNLDPYKELEPLPGVKEIMVEIQKYIYSPEILKACGKNQTLSILRGRLNTSIFHLNLIPETIEDEKPTYLYMDSKYPYDHVFEKPFPKRPSLETIDKVIEFVELIQKNSDTIFETPQQEDFRYGAKKIIDFLKEYEPYKDFPFELNERHKKGLIGQEVSFLSKEEILQNPVMSYMNMRKRLLIHGESASFPEYAESVDMLLEQMASNEMQDIAKKDVFFKDLMKTAMTELNIVAQNQGKESTTQSGFEVPYPYRRTINAIEQAIAVYETKERLLHEESPSWHAVEKSWYEQQDKDRRLLPELYHFHRYKYHLFGLLSNPNVILFPWNGDASFEDLMRLRPVPIGIMGVCTQTIRTDRFFNTPLDFWYHDANHFRRMWGYDKRLIQNSGLDNEELLQQSMHDRSAFVKKLLDKTNFELPNLTEDEREIRYLERLIIFETFHETALSATRESMLNDLTRHSDKAQPFEIMTQNLEYITEKNRIPDGNLISGANILPLIISEPTHIKYFFYRSTGFLSGVYNKMNWGFYDSVFSERLDPKILRSRTPENLAKAALNLFKILDFPENQTPSEETLINKINDFSSVPELFSYFFCLHHPETDDSIEEKANQKQSFFKK
jgi:hypothetical protein